LGKGMRMSRFFAEDGKALVAELDLGLSLGPVGNLLNIVDVLRSALGSHVDAIVLNRGQIAKLESLIPSREGPAIVLRADFTNALRDSEFTLPPKKLEHIKSAGCGEALALGADGVAVHLLVGYEDEEARSVDIISSLIEGCNRCGLMVLAEAIPIGERITEANYIDSLRLAVRMAVEAGADVVATPYAGEESSMRSVVEVAGSVPLLAIDDPRRPLKELGAAISAGCAGLVLRDRLISEKVENAAYEAWALVHGC